MKGAQEGTTETVVPVKTLTGSQWLPRGRLGGPWKEGVCGAWGSSKGQLREAERGGHSGRRRQMLGTAQCAQVRGRGAGATAGGRPTERVSRAGRARWSRA